MIRLLKSGDVSAVSELLKEAGLNDEDKWFAQHWGDRPGRLF